MNSKTILGASLAVIFAVSIMMVPAFALAGFHNLTDADCDAGVALAAENDLLAASLEVDGKKLEIKNVPVGLDSTVHAFTVAFGPNNEICPVITDSI